MSEPESNGKASNNVDKAIAKTTRIIVFSGIAIGLLKALNPYKNNNDFCCQVPTSIQESKDNSFSPQEKEVILTNKKSKPIVGAPENEPTTLRTIKIIKGETLWGLSKKYGVSIDEIKDANGLTGNTIYAGKNLVIP